MKAVKIKFHVVMISIIRKQYNINTTKLSFRVVRLAETSRDIFKIQKMPCKY